MFKIINNTDLDFRRLLVLYANELNTLRETVIGKIVFDICRMTVYNKQGLVVLDIDEN